MRTVNVLSLQGDRQNNGHRRKSLNHKDVTRGAACRQFLLSAIFSYNVPFSLHVSCLIIVVNFSWAGRLSLDCATDPERHF